MVPSQGGRAQLCGRLIVFRSDDFQLWSELPALAPGARCRVGRSVGSGAPQAMQWTATGLTRQERQRSVEKCWSRGRIVSALLTAAQGGCLPSMEPPNPVAATMLPPARAGNGCSTFDTALHCGQRGFMKPASPGGWRRLPLIGQAVRKTASFTAGTGTSWSHHQQPEGVTCD